MIVVEEKKRENKNVFEVQTYSDKNKLLYVEELNFETSIKEHLNGVTYLLLYDEEMTPITEVFEFLNITLSNLSLNSRIKSLNALRILFIFEKVINKKLKDFDKTNITTLKYFLRGVSPTGQIISFQLQTKRSNKTINGYLSVYRQFLVFLKCTNSFLLEKSNRISSISPIDSDIDYKVDNYVSNERVSKEKNRVPMYISISEFKEILNEIRNNYTLCEECIVRLMFEAGLRLGEVLGLTGDDIISEVINNEKKFSVYIRNRYSDKNYQTAKTCMNITNKKQYMSKEYKTLNHGYQVVQISENLFNRISEYIEEAHSKALENKTENYKKYTIADKVKEVSKYEEDNYYVFLNTLGKPLGYQTWNNRLRDIFNAVGILVDKGSREHNLSHRFRHGFAMLQVQYMNMNELQLKEALRHKNLTTVSCYFRPTISDEICIKTKYIQELYEIIPELKLI